MEPADITKAAMLHGSAELEAPSNPMELLLHLLKQKKLCKKTIFVMLVLFANSPFMSHHKGNMCTNSTLT